MQLRLMVRFYFYKIKKIYYQLKLVGMKKQDTLYVASENVKCYNLWEGSLATFKNIYSIQLCNYPPTE